LGARLIGQRSRRARPPALRLFEGATSIARKSAPQLLKDFLVSVAGRAGCASTLAGNHSANLIRNV